MKNIFLIPLSICVVLAFVDRASLFAQNENILPTPFPETRFEHLSLKDGLPENSVNEILQDHFGFLWFGTQNGLVKYDGYSMMVFQPDINDPLSISSRIIKTLYEDNTGSLWIGTYDGGLNQFNRKTNMFTHHTYTPGDSSSISSNNVNCIYEDTGGRLWVGTDNGLNLLDQKTNRFQRFTFTDLKKTSDVIEKVSNVNIYAISEEYSTGNLYLGMGISGLWIFDVNRRIFRRDDFLNEDKVISKGVIRDFHRTRNGSLWIASSRGLSSYNPKTKELKSYQVKSSTKEIPKNNFYSVLEDQNGFIWARHKETLYRGLACLNPFTGNFRYYWYNAKNPHSLSTGWIWSLYEDRSGILWVGTWQNGVNKWDKMKWKFKTYQHDIEDPQSLVDNRVLTVYDDRSSNIWVGTKGGLDKFDRITKVFTHYQHDPKDDQSLSGNSISEIIEDPEESGVYWIGTSFTGLNKFDSKKNVFHSYRHDRNDTSSINSDRANSVLIDREGFIWVGTESGVNKLDRQTGRFKRFEEPRISQNRVGTIYEDKSGTLWVGTIGGGLNRFNREKGTFTYYKSLSSNRSYSDITTFYEDGQRNFWVGTFTGGLHLFDRNKGVSIKNFTQKEGLAHNAVASILEDKSGNLWISTRNGLSRYNPALNTFKNYGSPDGLPKDWFRLGIQSATTASGEMMLAGNDGLIIFHPDSIRDDPTSPQIVITNLSLFNRPDERLILNGFNSDMDEVEVLYNQNDLHFEFVGLHFGEPAKNKYKYLLQNFDKDWVNAGTQRNATYTNLDPGEYIFKVMAANRDGVWNKADTSLKIIITPPWWSTWWAYLIYIFFILSALYGIRRYELNRVNWKNKFKLDEIKLEERSEIDKMKSRFFANISHEFRTPLTLILGPAEKIIQTSSGEEVQKQIGLIKRNANRLLDLINQLLDLSKLEAGKLKLNASKGDIVKFVKGIMMSFESMAERNDISLAVMAGKDDIQIYFDRDKMAKILTNLFSNAFKFTPECGKITAYINLTEQNSVELKIRDTGIGISEIELPKLFDRFYQVDSSQTREHEGSGIGLALTKELVELHHGNISVESNHGEWTEFTVELPCGRHHLTERDILDEEKADQTDTLNTKNNLAQIEDSVADDGKISQIKENRLYRNGELVENNKEDKTIILVVEDNKDVREYIIDSLGSDFQIEEATNGEQGVKKAEKLIPDLIISDIMMPRIDGNELTRILKNDEKTSHIPVILLTARSEQESRLEGLETGADDYLTKPFDTKELQIRIKNLINIRKKLQEKYGRVQYISKTNGKKLNNLEEQFMGKVIETIEKHISEEEFSIEQFAEELFISRMQLHRKIKALTGKSASLYLRSFRLLRARKMIKDKMGNISEIAYSVGFSSPAYFTRCFRDEFGLPPSELPA